MKRLTQSRLDRWLAKWQPMLRLKDWVVAAGIVHRDEIDGVEGHCEHELTLKQANIRIASEKDRGNRVTEFDPEDTIVHELIHLLFAPFEYRKYGSPECIAQEQAIDSITGALMSQSREIEALKATIRSMRARRRK